MGIEETAGPQGPGAEGRPGSNPSDRGLSKRARVVILVVVLGGLLLVGMIVSARRRDDFDQKRTRVQIEAQAAGDTIDVEAFRAAYAKEQTGDEDRPARALVPDVAGAELSTYFVITVEAPTQVIIDYQFEAGGQDGCVRINRSAEGTRVLAHDEVCPRAFPTGP
jgi:hypothetical protein